MTNPLGPLPESDSPKGALDSLDIQKILRAGLMQVGGALVAAVVIPALVYVTTSSSFHWTVGGYDLTVPAVVAGGLLLETLRRLYAGKPKS